MKSTTRAWLFAGLVVLLFVAGGAWAQPAYKTKHVFIVVMDGVRWQDTFGDPNHSLIPNLWSRLRPQGCLFTNFYNNGITVTRQGHSTLISGTWQRCANGGARLTMPTLFDYYRDQTGAPAEKCWAIFGKGAYAFAPYSSFPVYADRFAPKFVYGQQGAPFNELSAEGDRGVLEKVLDVMKTDRPDVVFINFGYTDHAGHVAKDIAEYQAAIRNCDECFGKLWDAIQADPYYRDTTTVFFTNDHGRHTDDFHGHGDACEGCRHIMLLILGPDIKKGVTIDTPALQIDVAPTAAELLGIQTPLAQGRVLTECLVEPKNVNRKEAITETAKQAVALFQLASRDMFKAAGDYVAANVDPKQTAADLSGSLLARGMIRAAQETGDARYLDWAIAWIDAHRGGEGAAALSVADAVIDLPAEKRRGYMDWVRTVAGGLSAQPDVTLPGLSQRQAQLWAGAMLGRLRKTAAGQQYVTAGKALVTQALSAAAPQPGTREGAIDLLLLGQAAAAFPGEQAIGKAYLIELAQNLAHMKEIGGLWDDPVVSALGISAIRAATGSGVFRGLTAKPEKNAPKSELLEAMTPAELQKALGGKAPKIPDRARNTLSAFIANRARAQFGISVELLKYGVNQAGAYADGSPLAQGAFLMAWERPAWSYGGDAPQPAAGKRAGRQARAQTQKPKRARAAGQPAAGMAARRGDRANK